MVFLLWKFSHWCQNAVLTQQFQDIPMDLGQLQVAYDAVQDRLLMRVNTTAGQEVRVWLTRRLVGDLWPTWQRAVEHARGLALPAGASTDARRVMVSMEREQAVAQSDFSTPFSPAAQASSTIKPGVSSLSPYSPHYRSPANPYPLGETPLLISEVNLTPLPDGSLQTQWKDGRRTLGMVMNAQLMHAATKLIADAVAVAQWDVDVRLPDQLSEEQSVPASKH
jgi:hypothetical protein